MNYQQKLLQLNSIFLLPINSLGVLMASMVCLSLTPIFIRLSELEISPNATIFNRFWIAAVAFSLLNGLLTREEHLYSDPKTKENKPKVSESANLLVAHGISLLMGLISWAWSLTKTNIANSSLIHNLIPIFTILGSWLILGRTFDKRFLMGMLITLAGAILLEGKDLMSLSISQQTLGDLAALLSAVFFGIHPLIAEKLRTKFDSIEIMTWSSTTSALLLLPIVLISKEQIFPTTINGWLSVIALAIIGQMLGVGLWTYSLKKLSSGFASIVALIIPIFSAVEGWIIFSENLSILTLVSFVVILFGMSFAISSPSAIKSENESSH